ncbi:FUSC family protein [Pullulanibacillus sp. KACC 23026]|uniref:FUSC family protein n=1 Tax=Pullulanibacillus sp. KACC 23026 TaxID=3028315 RepID=UPI0023B206CE|nr:FUSC family protein [Pullulanibacillus sp. KACC 23026]WEG12412.1 FUSC family protein [Pullulanibacillus sp. KACC 23026]
MTDYTKEKKERVREPKKKSLYSRPPVAEHPNPGGIKGAFHWNKAPAYPWGKAVAAAFSLGIPFLLGILFHQLDLALLASMGSFTALYIHNEPYPQRALKLFLINLGLMISFGLGQLSAAYPLSMPLVFALVSAGSVFLSGAFRLPPPGGYFFVLVCAVGTILPFDLSEIPFRMGMAFAGGCLAWLLGMSGWIWNPHRQEKAIVILVYRLLSAYLDKIGKTSTDSARHQLTLALKNAEEAVLTSPFRKMKRVGKSLYLAHLIEKANDIFLSAIEYEARENSPIQEEFVRAPLMIAEAMKQEGQVISSPIGNPIDRDSLTERLAKDLMDAVTIFNEKRKDYNQLIQSPNRNIKSILSSAIAPTSVVLPASLRIGIAVLIAATLSVLLGNERPYWVSLACASALQGPTALAIVQRTIQRSVGTAIGIMIAGVIFFSHTSSLHLILIAMVFQFCVELTIVRNYTLAVVFITPMAMIITFFTHVQLTTLSLIEARLIDTILGAAVALLAGLFLWHGSASSRLPKLLGSTIQASGDILQGLLQLPASQQKQLVRQKNRLRTLLINLRAVYDGSIKELRTQSDRVEAYWLSIVAAERLGYFVLAALESPINVSIDAEKLREISDIFNELTEQAKLQQPIGELTFPEIPDFPGITREVNELIESLRIKDLSTKI